ncbi:MAG: hypothetical protein ACE5H3_04955, partial [Planctomycetota bacterium]
MLTGFRLEIRPARGALFLLLVSAWGCQLHHRAESAAVSPGETPPSAEESGAQSAPPTLEEIRAAGDRGDLEGALNLLDKRRVRLPGDAATWMLFGEDNLAFAEQLVSQGGGDPGLIEGLQADAANAFRKAGELLPGDPAPPAGLARALLAAGDPAGAWKAAEEVIRRLGSEEAGDPALLEEIGRAGLAVTIQALQATKPAPGAARQGERALRAAWAGGRASAVVPLADLLAWVKRPGDARAVLVKALAQDPGSGEFLGRLKNLDAKDPSAAVADLEAVHEAVPGDAGILWYLGEANYRRHEAKRALGDFQAAEEALDAAEKAFVRSRELEPRFAETCAQWLHLVRTARGWTLREEGRVDEAAEAFLNALEKDPGLLEEKADPGTLALGIYAVVDDYFKASALEEMEKARAFLARVTAAAHRNPDWENNLAFVCRELGVDAQRRKDEAAAARLFRQSWEAYTRAVSLSPDDPRLINDRALIAVYYLPDEKLFPEAERELQRAIRIGTARLKELPENVTQPKRRALEEAVGDAWENLAYLDLVR